MNVVMKRFCAHQGCNALVLNGYCPNHIQIAARDYRKSAAIRGYDREWREFRSLFLAKYPLCSGSDPDWKGQEPRTGSKHLTEATEVHHIERLNGHPELKLVESNCMPQCRDCHQIRTRRGE